VSLRGGLIKGEKLIDFFERNFVDRDFPSSTCASPASPPTCSTGREIWLHEGSVSEAVRASIAVPGLMTPVCTWPPAGRWRPGQSGAGFAVSGDGGRRRDRG
jgi:predicted acylesterase/phospholipase RssA